MPSSVYEPVTIRVSNKMLYVGRGTAYPLAGVVRVRWDELKINRWPYIRTLIVNTLLFLIFWFFMEVIGHAFVGGSSDFSDEPSGPPAWVGLLIFAGLVFFILRSVEPARTLWVFRERYFALDIDTAGFMGSRVINPNGQELEAIAAEIIAAIDNPAAEWQAQVINYHVGDTINQSGPESIGKVTT